MKLALRLVLGAGLWAGSLQAQLAVTEVMSRAGLESDPGPRRPDYWELTNYGDEDMNLDGYSFADDRRTVVHSEPFTNLVIRPGESVIFFRLEISEDGTSITNAARFRYWWGEANLPEGLQIRTYPDPGLNGETGGDELWIYDAGMNVVDSVKFREAWEGRSFVCEPDTGLFGVLSVPGAAGVIRAAAGSEYGSPGFPPPSSEVRIAWHPSDAAVDAGAQAMFTVVAYGLPRPRYQWRRDGVPIDGAITASLVISNAQPSDVGLYSVRVWNGLSEMISASAELTVSVNPKPPEVLVPPSDLIVYDLQVPVFGVLARGYPALRYQWQADGSDIVGATGPILTLAAATSAMSGQVYSVRIWNELGDTNVSATLTVTRRPCLRFSEVMARPISGDSSGHYDWFEIENCGTNAVDMKGYRFFDYPTFTGAYTIPESLILQASEAVVFVEEMSEEEFGQWWGSQDFGPRLRTSAYHGFSLGDWGETLTLWNAAGTDPYESVATVTWARASLGVSLECENWYDPATGWNGQCLTDSVRCERGAFASAINEDVASPAILANPLPRILTVRWDGSHLQMRCRVQSGKSYRLICTRALPEGTWTEVKTIPATDCDLMVETDKPESETLGFYRLVEVP